jgi:hypothetical protein
MAQNEGRSKLGWLQPVVVAVLIALLAGTTSPWWWAELKAVIVGASKPSQTSARGIQAPAPKSASLSVSITAPPNSEVDVHDFIMGKVSDKDSHVWLVIQPLETMACWVQKPVIVDDDGTWKASVQFGEHKTEHSGKRYEIRALANPRLALAPGPTKCWPQAEAISAALYVRRR